MPFDISSRPLPLTRADEVAHIAGRDESVVRNLQITQSYHHLGLALARRSSRVDAPWVLFAVWASKTAGRFIRGHWVRPELRAIIQRRSGAAARRFAAIDGRIRRNVALGNQLVYAEIAPLFVHLLELLDLPAGERPARLEQIVAGMPRGPMEDGGHDALTDALRIMVEAAALPPGPAAAQRMLLASLLIGSHEQYRLQTAIAGALDALWAFTPGPSMVWHRELRDRVAPWIRRRLTRRMMTMGLPHKILEVGRDVPALPGGEMFPADLHRIELPALRQVIARYDRNPHTTQGSAAADWGDYADRMNYLCDLFRSLQQSPMMWSAPFDAAQAAAIVQGVVPAGRL